MTGLGWAQQNTRNKKFTRFIWICCRFSFIEEEEKGNLDGSDLFFYKETEQERNTYGNSPLSPLI